MLIPIGFLGAGGAAGSYEHISTTILSSTTSSVTFTLTGLAATYKHLQVRATPRADGSGSGQWIYSRFNSDTASNYAWHRLSGNGSTVTSGAGATQTRMQLGIIPSAGDTSTIFGSHILDILDFGGTKNKTIRAFSATNGSSPIVGLYSGLWMNTAALTSITYTTDNNFVSGVRFSLYGIKGA